MLGLLGIGAVAALRRRRRPGARNTLLRVEPDPRADELKRRLEEARAAAADREEFEGAETPVDQAIDQTGAPVDERRRDVHDAARDEIDRMRGAGPEG